jgi:RNA polymerase sigma factor (sigma-70 family)
LRKLAAAKLAHEKPGQTLQATALVHEAYLRLVGSPPSADRAEPDAATDSASRSRPAGGTYDSRGHFFAAAAEAMRRILIDQARRKGSEKHGGQRQREELPDVAAPDEREAGDLLAVDEALEKLATHDPLAARLVKLRYFAGLTMDEAAESLGISSRTAYYTWAYARSWLHKEIAASDSGSAREPQKLPK